MKQLIRSFIVAKNAHRGGAFLCMFLIACAINSLFAQTTIKETFDNDATWSVPDGVTSITIEAWGGGGAGGNSTSNSAGGGGGGGFVSGTLPVTPSTTYTITVGAGGERPLNTVPARSGGNTSMVQTEGSRTIFTAYGGKGVRDGSSTGGDGGSGSAVSDLSITNGSSGSNSNGNNGGAGGKGGGNGGGAGGTGGSGSIHGGNGAAPGGGGGGAARDSDGGYGANGQVVIIYTQCPTYALTSVSTTSSFCSGAPAGDATITIAGTPTNLPAGTYTVTYTVNGITQTPKNVTVNASGIGVINVPIPTDQAGNVPIVITHLRNTASPNCENDISANNTVTVTVKPLPVLTLTTEAETVCSGTMVNPGLSSNISGTKYKITAVASSEQISGHTPSGDELDAFHADEILTNNGTTAGTVTYTITPTADGCTGAAKTYTVTVNAAATVDPVDNQVICNGGSTTPVEFTGTATSFQWEATGYATAMGIPTDLQTGNFGTYPLSNSTTGILTATITVTPIYGANDAGTPCKGDAKSFTVTVNPTPTITNTFTNQVLCNGKQTTPVEFTGTATSFQWEATGDATAMGIPTGLQTGNFGTYPLSNSTTGILTATITVTPIYGANDAEPPCKGDAKSFTVTVNPTPTITNTFTNQVICNGKQTTPVTFTGTATSFQWEATGDVITGMPVDVQTGNFGAYTLSNTTTGPLTATITVTPIYGANDAPCKGDAKSFTVTVNPTPQATISQDAEVCEGTEVTLTFILTTGTLPWSVTYSDDSGSRKTLTGATTTITDTVTPPVGTTSYYITEVTDGNGCVWPPQN